MGEGEPVGRIRRKQSTIPELEATIEELKKRFHAGETMLVETIQILQASLNKRRAKEKKRREKGESGTVTTLKPRSPK